MTRTAEARFWQACGALVGVVGGFVLAYDYGRYGLASIDPKALMCGLAASFLMLAGGACYIAGRALNVQQLGLTAREANLWKMLATVCLVAGGVVIIVAWRERNDFVLDRLAMGSAGAFSMMFGTLCMVGQRMMCHMHEALMGKFEEKSSAARV